jgi:hypothetical protein
VLDMPDQIAALTGEADSAGGAHLPRYRELREGDADAGEEVGIV